MNVQLSRSNRLKALLAALMAATLALTMSLAFSQKAWADDTEGDVEYNNLVFHAWYYNGSPGSVVLKDYTGTDTQVIIPGSFVVDGKTYTQIQIKETAFSNDAKKVQKIAIEPGWEAIYTGAFAGCTSLVEVAVGAPTQEYSYIGDDAFADCPNLKTYRFSVDKVSSLGECRIGQDSNGVIYEGVTVYAIAGSDIEQYVKDTNDRAAKDGQAYRINLITTEADPFSQHTVKPSGSGGSDNGGTTPGGTGPLTPGSISQMGADGTPLGAGASASAAEAALLAYSAESDPAGSVFGLLKAKISKVKTKSVKLSWSKMGGAKQYVIYGNACGKSNKLVKLATTSGSSMTFKKVNGKAVKKGTYYKFVVVALSADNTVVSTSKMVHAATTGGKVGNDKKVTTAAKKNKATIKKGKTFKLKAKAVPASKKLKVKRHRKVSFESDNPAIATVNAKGVIKGVAKGKCTVYAYAQNGVCAKIKVTVK